MLKFFGMADHWFGLYTCLTMMSAPIAHLTQQAQPLTSVPCYIYMVLDPRWWKYCVLVIVGINLQSLICSWWKREVYARLQGALFSLYSPKIVIVWLCFTRSVVVIVIHYKVVCSTLGRLFFHHRCRCSLCSFYTTRGLVCHSNW